MAEFGSMRQIHDTSSTREGDNISTCGFFARKGRCGQGFRNLPHTSVLRFRKCGENRGLPIRSRFCVSVACGFVAEIRVELGSLRLFPHFRKTDGFSCDMRCNGATSHAGRMTSGYASKSTNKSSPRPRCAFSACLWIAFTSLEASDQ